MFEFLKGRLAVKKPNYVVIDVGGVGYRAEVSLATFEALPAEGQGATLFTVLRTTDDAMVLYGFGTAGERALFLRLVESVAGLGPKKALAILSSAGPAKLAEAVEQGDVAALKRVKGIGDKLANRLVVELKGQLPSEDRGGATGAEEDALAALVGLGYGRSEAEEAVHKAAKGLQPERRTADELVRAALQHL